MNLLVKHIVRKLFLKTRTQSSNQMPMVVANDRIGMSIIANGFYEIDIVTAIMNSLDFNTHEHTCLDIGANIGNHSVQFSAYFKKVISFEPQIRNFKILKLNTDPYESIHANNYGLSSKNEEAVINIPYNNSGGASHVVESSKKNDYYSEQIQLRVYDDEFEEKVAFVKIDVEGNELEVIKGMKNTIEKYKPVISFEYNYTEKDEVLDILRALGYERFFAPKTPFINKLIHSGNLFPVKELEEITLPVKKHFALITTFHKDSSFTVKV
ncbi:FkbM family methyltransferase [Aquimarina sp. U1-2]|uniref:FkbM family methyltransferase n=1 Tax=Aquimarina sp. U1-2 TaxID=2823141 RepID=UPI001AECCD60|nr:FkbM family methyltransferase [Aquimarina sp. U1-2]MBP2833015.1 FkbM family methyltransferase [Aquimarina sp. U1-2]